MNLLCNLLYLAMLLLLAWVVLSYVVNFGRLGWGHPVRSIYDFLSRGIDPLLRPIRRVLPPLRMGGMGLDLSPMVLFLAVIIVQNVLCH